MAATSEGRRQRVLLVVLGVLVAVFVGRMLLSGNGAESSAASTPTSGALLAPASARATGSTTTTLGGTLAQDTFDVYSTRNPFEPAFQETASTEATTSTTAAGATTTTGAGGTTTTTVVAGTTTTTQPSYNPTQGTTVALLDVYLDGQTVLAKVQVGSTVSTVGVGDVFGPGTSYRVVSLDEPCGQFLYGDSPFQLCEGQQVIK